MNALTILSAVLTVISVLVVSVCLTIISLHYEAAYEICDEPDDDDF